MLELSDNSIIYVTRDIERALGLDLATPGYFIISNFTPFAKSVDNNNILLIDEKEQLDTWELLQHPKVIDYINSIKNASVLVFKNTKQIERACDENNWKLLNPSAELSDKIEEKISQLEWLDDLKKYLPDYTVGTCKDVKWNNEHFIMQFNRSHTGSGTFLIENEKQLKELQTKFPERPTRTAKYIDGPLFTNNNVIAEDKILMSNISYQITGLKPFTDNKFATIGNDWTLPHKYLNEKQLEKYNKIVKDIGKKLQVDGWKGLFGVDIVVDDKTGELFLVEINARQPASTTFESELQREKSSGGSLSIFEAHLLGLLDLNIKDNLTEIKNGAQIVQRVTKNIPSLHEPKYNKRIDINVIKYNNTKLNSDLLRTQTHYSIMDGHNQLNREGLKIIDFITVTQKGNGWDLPRGAILAIKDNKILLIERQKYSQHFFTPPGGTKEEFDEDILATAKREGKEETNLDFTIPEQTPLHFNVSGRDEYYFFAENTSGKLELGEEETARSNEDNSYELVWVDLKELKNIKLLPEGLTEKLLKHLN